MNRTSRSSRLVSSAARSPAFAITGPDVARKPTPSSRATICASLVLESDRLHYDHNEQNCSAHGCHERHQYRIVTEPDGRDSMNEASQERGRHAQHIGVDCHKSQPAE